jgi:amino acid transporter
MIGVGWLILMNDWLERGGPWGGIIGFLLGGVMLLPVGYVYGRLVMAIPDAGSEIAYTARVFPAPVSFLAGWMMLPAYLAVCPWESVAIGRVASYIFPGLERMELYRVGGQPIFLPNLILGLLLTAGVVYVNYRGIQISAGFQNWTTAGALALFVVFSLSGLAKGNIRNTLPPFSHASSWVSILLVLQIVPYFMTGFESVPKCAEEASPEFRERGFFRAILAALFAGAAFYCIIIFVAGYSWPWQQLVAQPLATTYALQHAIGSQWVVYLVLVAALLSLAKIFNATFLVSTRMLFALGRREMIDARLSRLHPRHQTPWVAVVMVGLFTAAGTFLGRAILVPITEVGSLAAACGWFSSCAAYFVIEKSAGARAIAVLGAMVSLVLIAMKVCWFVPGHFSRWEWLTLALWLAIGGLARYYGKAHSPRRATERAASN